jgi:hypothetical protein
MWHRCGHICRAIVLFIALGMVTSCARPSRGVQVTARLIPADQIAPVVKLAEDKVQIMTLPLDEAVECFPQMPVWVRRSAGFIQTRDVALYDNRRLDTAYHRVAFIEGGRVGYSTPAGEVIIPANLQAGQVFQEGIAVVQLNGKYGYIDPFGEWLVKPELDFAYGFWFGVGAAEQHGKYGLIDHAGKWIKEPTFAYMAAVGGGIQAKTDAGEEGFIDSRGNFVKEGKLASFYRPPKSER